MGRLFFAGFNLVGGIVITGMLILSVENTPYPPAVGVGGWRCSSGERWWSPVRAFRCISGGSSGGMTGCPAVDGEP